MNQKHLPFLLVIAVIATLGVMKYSRLEPQTRFEIQRRTRHLPVQQPQPTDPAVCCSILQNISLSIEIQPQWNQEHQFLLQVNVEKPIGTTYCVNPVEQSFILFVDGHPWATPEFHQPTTPAQDTLKPSLGSRHSVLRFPPDIPDGAELVIEWINYNLRTGQLERLRSQPLTVTSAG
ncbi:MAG: hypothetical protein AAF709_22485 [Pseudomonadota bacterium]